MIGQRPVETMPQIKRRDVIGLALQNRCQQRFDPVRRDRAQVAVNNRERGDTQFGASLEKAQHIAPFASGLFADDE